MDAKASAQRWYKPWEAPYSDEETFQRLYDCATVSDPTVSRPFGLPSLDRQYLEHLSRKWGIDADATVSSPEALCSAMQLQLDRSGKARRRLPVSVDAARADLSRASAILDQALLAGTSADVAIERVREEVSPVTGDAIEAVLWSAPRSLTESKRLRAALRLIDTELQQLQRHGDAAEWRGAFASERDLRDYMRSPAVMDDNTY